MGTVTTKILESSPDGLQKAVTILKAGGLVALPTETVYGLAADATNAHAVAGIFDAKQRPRFNPLIIHVADLKAAQQMAQFDAQALKLARQFWPGPLSLVLPLKPNTGLSDLVTAGLGTVAIRVPQHDLARHLLIAFGGPLAAPSANPSGKISPTTAAHVRDGLEGRIAAIVDGGPCSVGLESTILRPHQGKVFMLRAGGLAVEVLQAALGQKLLVAEIGGAITSPGQLAAHYAPEAGLRLNVKKPHTNEVLLGFGKVAGAVLNLSETSDLKEAATHLFGHLRRLDQWAAAEGKTIAVSPVPEHGLGLAINDRLARAAVRGG